MLCGIGVVKVTQDGVRIITGIDLIRYYEWFIKKATFNTIKLQLPKHGSHITIANKKLHNFSISEALQFQNETVHFNYFPEKMYQSRVNFWIPVESERALEIKKALKITETKNWWGFHLTVANQKFN